MCELETFIKATTYKYTLFYKKKTQIAQS